ncbi:FAD-binding domain-containing protein OS=Streptomyces fumanus OX=67302 GN=GCM10018772_62340 PE=4 SV=1 [Streptomyces fumanus]
MTDAKHAVVMGAGLAGMLAARVLAPHVDRVTVVDRDTMPDGPYLRKGLPQARHAHLLMSGGARTIDALLPGTTDRLLAAGGHRIGLPADVVSLTAYGWQQRFQGAQFMITCSRELLDWTVREAVLRDSRITLRDGVEVVGPRVAGGRVTGVVVRPRDGSAGPVELAADFVVDCTGRGSPAKKWLAELGLPPVREETVDSGLRYSSRVFRALAGAERDFPVVSVYPAPPFGTAGAERGARPDRGRPVESSPVLGDPGGRTAERRGRVRRSSRIRQASDRRPPHRGRRTGHGGAGLPQYAQPAAALRAGRRVAGGLRRHGRRAGGLQPGVRARHELCQAQAAGALEGELRRLGGLGPQLGKRVQRAVSAVVDDPWILATTQDLGYPGCRSEVTDARLADPSDAGRRFADLASTAALSEPAVAAATMEVTTLSAPLTRLRSPEVLAAVQRLAARPAGTPASAEPPLRAHETALLTACSTHTRKGAADPAAPFLVLPSVRTPRHLPAPSG